MVNKPICAIEGCSKEALVLFGGQWICGECLAKYDRKIKEEAFNKLQKVLKDGS